eukprot:TRINITY_DN2201_c0_g1_i3.p1 TRINITY_DN2201_c0_g1~~TRINITY_DN2201_c0_g1_i3.p1  ORF type:complete len:176 (+),score=29.98 TRINITY_DN2201_c0_g1_i3:159-686(+)
MFFEIFVLRFLKGSFLGLGAGKTTLLYSIKLGAVKSISPTIGFHVESIRYRSLDLVMWDIGGQDRLRKLWEHYYSDSRALIYVVDSNDIDRIDESAREFTKIVRHLDDVPVLIFANKQDLPYAVDISTLSERFGLFDLPESQPWHIQSCCAIEGGGLCNGLDWLSEMLRKKRFST